VERDYNGTVPGDLAEAKIMLGNAPCEFDIDDLRISNIPRETFDLSKPAVLDEHTLLLDRLDAIDPHSRERATGTGEGRGRHGARRQGHRRQVGGTHSRFTCPVPR